MPEFKGSRQNEKFHIEITFTPEENPREYRQAIGAATVADANISHYDDSKIFSGEDSRTSAIDALSKTIPLDEATAFIDQLINNGEATHSF